MTRQLWRGRSGTGCRCRQPPDEETEARNVGCCARRAGTGVDVEQVRRAVAGLDATLNPTEMRMVIAQLADRGAGLRAISGQLSYSRSCVAAILADLRARRR